MQKIKIGHRANFLAKYECFPQILFPVRAILRSINFRCTDFNTDSADACILVMKTLSSLLNFRCTDFNTDSADACILVMACVRALIRRTVKRAGPSKKV